MPHSRAKTCVADRRVPAPSGDERNRATKVSPARAAAPVKAALVVDPDPTTSRICGDVLEAMGFAVEAVDSGVAAVVAARGRVPDVILMESQLRDVSATEAIGWLRSNAALKSVPVVVITGNDEPTIPLNGSGVSTLLRKPLSPAALERTMREIRE